MTTTTAQSRPGDPAERRYVSGPRIGDYLDILRRRWRLIAVCTIVGAVVAAGYALISPHTYIAVGTLMPPDKDQGGGAAGFAALLQSGEFDLGSLGAQKGAGGVFRELLESRTLADSLISRLDLIERLDLPPDRRLAIDAVRASLLPDVRNSGVIEVACIIETPRLPSDEEIEEARAISAEIVNESMVLLDELNRTKIVTRARSSREFLERMVDLKRDELDDALGRLAAFQKENKAIALDAQIDAAVGTLAELRAQLATLELEKAALEQDLAPNAGAIEQVDRQISEVRRQLARSSATDVLGLNLSSAPDLSKQFAALKLDVEVATQVYAFLESQYHSEQIAENRDLPTVSVLDEARPPALRSSPRRTFITIVGTILGFIVGCVLVLLFELFAADFRSWRQRSSEQ